MASVCGTIEAVFEANDVKDGGKQRVILLSVCSADTYKLISSLVAPAKPGDKTFMNLYRSLRIISTNFPQ